MPESILYLRLVKISSFLVLTDNGPPLAETADRLVGVEALTGGDGGALVAGAGTLAGVMVAACTGVVGRAAGGMVAGVVAGVMAGSTAGMAVDTVEGWTVAEGGTTVVVARMMAATVVTARKTGIGRV
jgi:hypothetical protein